MSKLDDLLKQYCPDGVEYKRLNSVVKIKNGRDYKSFSSGDIPVYGSGGIMTYINNYAYDKSSVLIPRKGSLGNILYVDTPFWTVDTMFYTEINTLYVHPRFLYHVLLNAHLEKMNLAGGVPSLTQSQLNALSIPVPPLIVQNEIVRILDAFTKLTAELTAELTARRTQYEYYRDKLLSFDDETAIVKRIKDMLEQTCGGPENVENLPIGQLCNVSRGKVISKEYILEHTGKYPVFSSQTEDNGCLGEIDSFDYEGQFVTWTTDGANAGTVFYRDGKFNITNVCGLLSPKDTSLIEPKYLFYCLQIKAKNYVSKGMGNPKLMSNVMEKIPIPVPPIEIQQEIASVLDKFNALATDIISGLPAEISLRQKQYEHYRDRLLNFNGGV